jgi:hypothetical protein
MGGLFLDLLGNLYFFLFAGFLVCALFFGFFLYFLG